MILCRRLLLGLPALAFAAPLPLTPRHRLTFQGLGPLYIGMPESRLAASLSDPLEDPEAPNEACHSLRFATENASPLAGLVLVIRASRLARIDIDTPDWQTLSGARVRMPESALRQIYGRRLREEPHPIDATGRLLILPATDPALRHLAILFESDGDRITRIRSGLATDLSRLEDCP
jgi:hypothetical protein